MNFQAMLLRPRDAASFAGVTDIKVMLSIKDLQLVCFIMYLHIMHPKRIQEFGYRDPTYNLKRTFKMVEMFERVDTIYKHLN